MTTARRRRPRRRRSWSSRGPRIRGLEDYRVLGAHACYYDVEDDERFVVEPLSPRCIVMSGFSGHGFKFASVLGLGLAAAAAETGLMPHLAPWAAGQAAPAPGLLAALEEVPA